MLIDASHPEETRVAVVSGKRLDDFDYETSRKTQLKGNVYLAKVVRVEPSLQAAFVDYGGNRHGFLAFSEIHPDYYQIPVADREQLLAEDNDLDDADDAESGSVETVGGDDAEELERRRLKHYRHYKIQEVIKRRQIMLVQVVKEERGNKGAALTTYLSLAGRYCVLMPNTARGGGISRKIASQNDRRRLKKILDSLKIPQGMAVIVRTAGAERTKAEIKRDYEYLLRLWDEIRSRTMESIAPALVHEEANLIKRSIRDLYSKDIDEVTVDGEEGYRIAKDFMKSMVPSHAKRVQRYEAPSIPLFFRYQVENQIDAIYNPVVQLRSGGYLVIHATEALVAIDVNSGRSTRERHIEETALKTNLEAAEEVARQLRLRDLAGLIVIDFIDMEEHRNNAAVERRLKEALRSDRARIQLGHISPFGLLEMSRQRLRPSLIETSSEICPSCGGTGHVRSTESTALHVMRGLEEEGLRRRASEIALFVPISVALYILNHKREALLALENRYAMMVTIMADDGLIPPEYRIERVRTRDSGEGAEEGAEEAEETRLTEEDTESGRRKRRPRRRRKDRGEEGSGEAARPEEDEEAAEVVEADEDAIEVAASTAASPSDDEGRGKRRRRGKRGGRRRGRRSGDGEPPLEILEEGNVTAGEPAVATESSDAPSFIEPAEFDATLAESSPSLVEEPPIASKAEEEPAPRKRRAARRGRTRGPETATEVSPASVDGSSEAATVAEGTVDAVGGTAAEAGAPEEGEKPAKRTRRTAATAKSGTKRPATKRTSAKKATAEVADEKSKARKRATRKPVKKKESEIAAAQVSEPPAKRSPEGTGDDHTEASPTPSPEQAPEPPARDTSLVTLGGEPAETRQPKSDEPKRSGWWRRTVGR